MVLTTNDDAVSDGDCELIFLFIGQRNTVVVYLKNTSVFGMVLKVIMAIIVGSNVFKSFKRNK